MDICDTVKGNESHVGNIQFWFFNINLLSIKNATFWSKPHLNQTYGCTDMNNSVKFKNNVKHKNLSPLVACNSKSIFPTSDSFPLIMSHIALPLVMIFIKAGHLCTSSTVQFQLKTMLFSMFFFSSSTWYFQPIPVSEQWRLCLY